MRKGAGALALGAVFVFSFAGCETLCDLEGTPAVAPDFGKPAPESPAQEAREPVVELKTVYFDYNRAEIRRDQRAVLRGNVAAILGSDWKRIVVEGHCDERGSEEYNLALGARRARIVRQYLIDNGVPAERIDTVSYGEARPAVRGHNERAWSQNRRAVFSVTR